MELFKPGKRIDFMAQRKFWIPFSIFLVIASTVLAFFPGPNYGTDFRGGTEIELDFKQNVDAARIRGAIEDSKKFAAPDVVQVKSDAHPNRFLIRVQDVSTISNETIAAVKNALCYHDDGVAVDETRCPVGVRATEVKFSAGGDKITTRYDAPPDLEKVKAQVKSVPGVALRDGPSNPTLTNPRDHRVEIQLQSKGDALLVALHDKLGPEVVPDQALRVEWVGPKAGKQLRDSARNSVVLAIGIIMLYLAFRFDFRFAPGVVLACVHDAMVVIGVFVIFRKEVTLSTIAAILTIIGYSMNDTVVVYDRIRENLSHHRNKKFAEIINLSVSETLSRTILTSGFTMLSILPFFHWGTGPIRDFALAMAVGIIAGTYSSIYVAAPLTEWIDTKLNEQQAKRKLALSSGTAART